MNTNDFHYFKVLSVLAVVMITLYGCCASDTRIGPNTSRHGPYQSLAACNTALTGTTPCTLIAAPTAACRTHCIQNSSFPGGCVAAIRNAVSTPGNNCFINQQDDKYYYSCVNQATCHCL